ncbi:MAG: hypothetical protein QM667_09885 [Asticcacaulis sp.]
MLSAIAMGLVLAAGDGQETTEAQRKADGQKTVETRDLISKVAFDPALYFANEPKGSEVVLISYTGDDYGWPVYSIAVHYGCTAEGCNPQRRARMVRAPITDPSDRPRRWGLTLVNKVTAKGASTPEAVAGALDTLGLDWVEADLMTCPGAMTAMADLGKAEWIRDDVVKPDPNGSIEIVLHADRIRVEVPDYLRKATYDGFIAKGSPAAWADALAKTLEPCWKPVSASPPWKAKFRAE